MGHSFKISIKNQINAWKWDSLKRGEQLSLLFFVFFQVMFKKLLKLIFPFKLIRKREKITNVEN